MLYSADYHAADAAYDDKGEKSRSFSMQNAISLGLPLNQQEPSVIALSQKRYRKAKKLESEIYVKERPSLKNTTDQKAEFCLCKHLWTILRSSLRKGLRGRQNNVGNHDFIPHTATAGDGSFDSDVVSPGESFSIITKGQGVMVAYFCEIHPSIQDVVAIS
jgi:hypothetical protein